MADQTAAPPAVQPGTVVDPYRAYNFKLIIQDVIHGHFTGVEGLGIKIDRILFREGGENSAVRVLPGRVEYPPVTLRFGMTDSTELIRWIFTASEGRATPKNVSLAMLNDSGSSEVRRLNLIRAWPSEWRGSPLDALGRDLAIESLTITYDRLELEDAAAPVA